MAISLTIKQEILFGLASVVVIFLALGAISYKYRSYYQMNNNNPSSNGNSNQTQNRDQSGQSQTFSLVEVAKHNTQQDCWLAIDNKVYDVTDYINKHPGGAQRIITNCGQDASQAFKTQGGQGMHSSLAKKLLSSFQIGVLQP